MRNMISVLVLFLGFHTAVFADSGEPIDDYSILCKAEDSVTSSRFELSGGVDPSGAFAMMVRSSGKWQKLNGYMFLAKPNSSQASTLYTAINPRNPKTTLVIRWDPRLVAEVYSGVFKQVSANGSAVLIPLNCTVRVD